MVFVTTGGAQIVTLTWEFVFKATVAELSFLYNFIKPIYFRLQVEELVFYYLSWIG